MNITRIKRLINKGNFSEGKDYQRIKQNIEQATVSIQNPPGSGKFILHDKIKGNGVVPIKDAFITTLNELGWEDERIISNIDIRKRKFDSAIKLSNGKYFAVEWETGNISSSHRALNRISLGILDGLLDGGLLILPSRKMYKYLTDRIGNYQELEAYFRVWEAIEPSIENGLIEVIEIEHDDVSFDVPPIKKGTDGRALK
ncbi:restriction endonuclease [Paenibacillus sp. UNC499MF]|uniref:restriction endonuclease n=1 Tax=Paenibacillus sp. UNC499MF TaxID=1502751 RepID=UPI0008A02127|nr:restriction endonuclease [Paenibacillus sp. UNC499MF]SEG75809.1 Restriction endonuclease BamHI [Paenibacillus sp. UNC499MF]